MPCSSTLGTFSRRAACSAFLAAFLAARSFFRSSLSSDFVLDFFFLSFAWTSSVAVSFASSLRLRFFFSSLRAFFSSFFALFRSFFSALSRLWRAFSASFLDDCFSSDMLRWPGVLRYE